MKINENQYLSGPLVRKREIFFVLGLVVCWGVVVYFLISKSSATNAITPLPSSRRVDESEFSAALLKKFDAPDESISNTPESYPSQQEVDIPMERDEVDQTLRAMKAHGMKKTDVFSTLVVSESVPAETLSPDRLVLEEPVTSSEGDLADTPDESPAGGDVLETPAEPNPLDEPPTTERIKS